MNEKYEWEQNKPDSNCLTLIMVCAILFNIQSCDHEWNFYTFHPLDVETSFCGSVCEAHLWRDIKTAACLAESESRTASSSSWDSFRDASLAQLWDSYYTGSCTHAIFWWEEIFLRISARWLSNFLLLSQISVDKVFNPLKTIWNLIHCSLMKVITHWTWQMSVLDHDIRKYQSGPVWTDVRTLYGEGMDLLTSRPRPTITTSQILFCFIGSSTGFNFRIWLSVAGNTYTASCLHRHSLKNNQTNIFTLAKFSPATLRGGYKKYLYQKYFSLNRIRILIDHHKVLEWFQYQPLH